MITYQRLREVFEYIPETGEFRRLKNSGSGYGIGSVAGSKTDRGYWKITVDGGCYRAHRLAWLYMTGDWPSPQIDHINGHRSDNRWENLRQATNRQNHANSKMYKTNKSGVKGVSWDSRRGKWTASITVNYKSIHLGRHDSIEDAATAYRVAAEKHFGEFARAP